MFTPYIHNFSAQLFIQTYVRNFYTFIYPTLNVTKLISTISLNMTEPRPSYLINQDSWPWAWHSSALACLSSTNGYLFPGQFPASSPLLCSAEGSWVNEPAKCVKLWSIAIVLDCIANISMKINISSLQFTFFHFTLTFQNSFWIPLTLICLTSQLLYAYLWIKNFLDAYICMCQGHSLVANNFH